MRTFDGFFETLGDMDWLGILVATLVVGVVLGTIFYGPVFGKQWAAASGMPYTMKPPMNQIVWGTIIGFIFQIGVAFLGATDDIEHSIVTALVFGVFILGPVLYARVIWAKGNRTAFFIDFAYLFLAIAVGGYVQGLMA